jgi:hypothetical protein
MGKLKKAFILLSIVGLTFGYSLATFSVMPQKAEAAKANDAKIVQNEAAAENELDSDASDETVQNDGSVGIQTCQKPSGGTVVDGNGTGYFNTQNQITASWDGFDDHGDLITKYKYSVWKKVSGPDTKIVDWTKINDPNIKSFTANAPFLVDLEEGGLYYTKVKAKNSCGWSKPAIKSVGQTLDTIKPTINSFALFQNRPYGENVTLSWTASDTGGSGIKSYQLYRNGVPSILDKTVLSYPDTIFGDNLTYSYYLIAIDEAGNPSSQSTTLFATVDDIAPAAPSISYWIGGGNIVVFWPAVSGATNYELYRNGVLIYSGPEVKYTDTHLTKGQTYNYTAYALDGAGNKSLASNTLQIYVPKPRVSTVSTTATGGEVQGETTTQGQQVSPSPSPSPSVQASETSKPSETAETNKKNWSLIIAIIIAAAIVVAGVFYWWYAREDEDEI